MDRAGGGDSFESGLIYGLMTTEDAFRTVKPAWGQFVPR